EIDRDSGTATVLVQSEKPPDWSPLPPGYLTRPAEFKPFAQSFRAGQRLVFRLRANPTSKTGTTSKADRLAGRPTSNGRRVGLVRDEDQIAWLVDKGRRGGFRIVSDLREADGLEVFWVRVIPEGITGGSKPDGERAHRLSHLAVRFEGLLTVTNPEE